MGFPHRFIPSLHKQEVSMGEIIHTSHIKLIKDAGPVRRAYIEDFTEPFYYGVHGKIAGFYGITPDIEYPATLDHIVSAVAG
jgi:hypothetical protein